MMTSQRVSSTCTLGDESRQVPATSFSETRPGIHMENRTSTSDPEVHIQVTNPDRRCRSECRPSGDDDDKASSSGRRFSWFSSQAAARFSGLFGSRSQTSEPKENHGAATNQDYYDKFRSRPIRSDRQSSSKSGVKGNSTQAGQESSPNADGEKLDELDCESPSMIKPARYFDALHGPELDEPRNHEVLLLPKDELWPFLLRFPLNSFGVCLGLGSQSILWKRLHTSPELAFLRIPCEINLFLWSAALLALVVISTTYALKVLFYFEAVRREYFHPVRVNFLFATWIAAMFLAIGLPPEIDQNVHPAVFCCFMAPIFLLELKLYGQWLSGGKRRLSKVANPSTHLSIVGNFVGSLLAARVGWVEPAVFFWAVGLAHYLVLFVTLYQWLPTNEKLPNDLHPVFSLFIAAPSTASVAWQFITGRFDYVSRLVFFVALFLYISLVLRINFSRGIKFTLSWWAYTFPMTGAAIAAIEYADAVPHRITQALATVLSAVASCTVLALFIITVLHWLVWQTLFQNDSAIAIRASGAKVLSLSAEATALTLSTEAVMLENEPLHKLIRHHIQHLMARQSKYPPAVQASMLALVDGDSRHDRDPKVERSDH